MSTEGSTRAILAALLANAGIAVAKFVGYLITGSSSMLAESVHSVADTSNQGLLLFGQRQAARRPTRCTSSDTAAAGTSTRSWWRLCCSPSARCSRSTRATTRFPTPSLKSPMVAVVILVVAIGLEGYSFRTAIVESRPLKGSGSWWRFIRNSRNPELPVVLLEDTGALIGLVFALAGVGLTVLTGDPVWDGVGTVGIGVLLGVIAVILMVEMHSLLIGEGATKDEDRAIRTALEQTDKIDRVIHMRTQYLGPDELLVGAKIALAPSTDLATVAATIDAAEAAIRAAVPAAHVIYLEPDLDRAKVR